jgi:hypothetical protein
MLRTDNHASFVAEMRALNVVPHIGEHQRSDGALG